MYTDTLCIQQCTRIVLYYDWLIPDSIAAHKMQIWVDKIIFFKTIIIKIQIHVILGDISQFSGDVKLYFNCRYNWRVP